MAIEIPMAVQVRRACKVFVGGRCQFNVVSLRLKQEMVSDSADVQLSVYADKSGVPDFDSKIAESILSGIIRPDSDSDIAFTFPPKEDPPPAETFLYQLIILIG